MEPINEGGPTKKHFQMVADTVRAIQDPKERQKFAEHHASVFAQQNPRFDHARFHAAAGTQYHTEDGVNSKMKALGAHLRSKKKDDWASKEPGLGAYTHKYKESVDESLESPNETQALSFKDYAAAIAHAAIEEKPATAQDAFNAALKDRFMGLVAQAQDPRDPAPEVKEPPDDEEYDFEDDEEEIEPEVGETGAANEDNIDEIHMQDYVKAHKKDFKEAEKAAKDKKDKDAKAKKKD